ncbi:MAG: chorismate-binding protein, partial [Lentisphaeria bacterium]
MFKPSYKEFCKMAEQGNLIPVYREQLADLETPVSVFSRFADDNYAFLLESIEGGERWGRYSFIGVNPHAVFTVHNGVARLVSRRGNPEVVGEGSDCFRSLERIMAGIKPVEPPGLPRLIGGAVGYIGYETVNEFEQLPDPKNITQYPQTALMLAEDLIVFDNVKHTLIAVACARTEDFESLETAYEDACCRVEELENRLNSPVPKLPQSEFSEGDIELTPNMSREEFCEKVRRTKDYIVEGDIIQTVLSQRFSTAAPAHPLAMYRALRLINPSPYTFALKFNDDYLVGSSPEVMVRLTGNRVELRPIAGTRPRGATEQEDRALADELLNDEKERAEHVMLVDLGRNDLGRIAVPGSVQVRDFMTIERYSHVMHIVSHVQADLLDDKTAFDVIAATFPAGTLTGAPKIRAM